MNVTSFYVKVLQNLKRLFSQIIYLVASLALMPYDISIVGNIFYLIR